MPGSTQEVTHSTHKPARTAPDNTTESRAEQSRIPGRKAELSIVSARGAGRFFTSAAGAASMRKTARPVVWEGAGAQSPSPDPIMTQHRATGAGSLSSDQLPGGT